MSESTWLDDDQLRGLAISLIFEDRLSHRLEYIHRTHAETNGLEMFDKMERVLEGVKNNIDSHLMRNRWGEVDEQGKEHWLTLDELRENTTLPTFTDFPTLFPKSTHIGWHDAERARVAVTLFKIVKESAQLLSEAKGKLDQRKGEIEAEIEMGKSASKLPAPEIPATLTESLNQPKPLVSTALKEMLVKWWKVDESDVIYSQLMSEAGEVDTELRRLGLYYGRLKYEANDEGAYSEFLKEAAITTGEFIAYASKVSLAGRWKEIIAMLNDLPTQTAVEEVETMLVRCDSEIESFQIKLSERNFQSLTFKLNQGLWKSNIQLWEHTKKILQLKLKELRDKQNPVLSENTRGKAGKDAGANGNGSFVDLFRNPKTVTDCVRALSTIDPPVINDAGNWIGRRNSKSILVAWIEVLEQRNKISYLSDRVELSQLLNQHFPGLALDTRNASIFGKLTSARTKYHADFLRLIQ